MTVVRVWNHATGESYDPRERTPERSGRIQIIKDIPEYVSPVNGKVIGSRSERREDLKRTGCREADPSEKSWWERERQKRATAQEKAWERAVEDTYRRMHGG